MSESPLSDEDSKYLDANFPGQWEKLSETGKSGVLIRDYALPTGYTADKGNLMVIVPASYPVAGLDMFYFRPPLVRKDDKTIAALSVEQYFGKEWQRWSRHYDWNPAEHNLITHVSYIYNQLETDAQ